MEITIAIGLPGSGKTSILNDKLNSMNLDVSDFFYIDEVCNNNIEQLTHLLNEEREYFKNEPSQGIIDMLFIDLRSLRELKDLLDREFKDYKMNVYLFNNDLESALVNDFIRNRDKSAELAIRHMSENWEFTETAIRDIFPNVNIISKEVHKPTSEEFLLWAKKVHNRNITPKYIRSESWHVKSKLSIDQHIISDDVERTPSEFKALYDFLKIFDAQEHYDTLMDKVEVVSDSLSDMYDTWEFKYYQIDTKTVLDAINYDNNLI